MPKQRYSYSCFDRKFDKFCGFGTWFSLTYHFADARTCA
jgi:hypothetical protein